jgi:outer membrane protein OmpA-like peptidoglycan-associated protein
MALILLFLALPVRAEAQMAEEELPPEQPSTAAAVPTPPENEPPSDPAAAAAVVLPLEREPQPLFSDTSNPDLYNPLPLTSGRQTRISGWSGLAPSPPGDMGHVIHFDAGSDLFLPTEYYRLDTLAAMLKRLPPDSLILVDGHSIAIGNPALEMDLSFRRARRLVEAMRSRGIDENRMVFRGWGSVQPLVSNATDEGQRLNRRAEITILNAGEPLP